MYNMVTKQALLQTLTKTQSPKSGAIQEAWEYVTTIPVRVYVKKTVETIKEVRYYKITTTMLTKYPGVKEITNRLVIDNDVYVINNVNPGAWYTLSSYTLIPC